VDNRVVAATNRDLPALMANGKFREDLFYRLNVFPLYLPPLRERLDDLPVLVDHLLKKHADLSPAGIKKLSSSVIPAMMNYSWKGNIRELENLVKRAIIKCTGDTITSVELPTGDQPPLAQEGVIAPEVDSSTPYKEYLSAIVTHAEKTYLLRMLRLNKGNVNQIARMMDIDRKTLYRKMTEYALDPQAFRA
jgi:DNA-binding NtrC family response regulator